MEAVIFATPEHSSIVSLRSGSSESPSKFYFKISTGSMQDQLTRPHLEFLV